MTTAPIKKFIGQEPEKRGKGLNLIVAILMAVVLWGYVIGQTNPTTKEIIPDVPVQLLNMDSLSNRGLVIVGDTDYTVTLVVEGRRADVSGLTAEDITVEANLLNYGVGENNVQVEADLPSNVDLVEIRPGRLVINIEERIQEDRPVEVVFEGQIRDGQEVGSEMLSRQRIFVSGPASYVASVKSAQITVPVEDCTGTEKEYVPVPVDENGEEVDNVRLSESTITYKASVLSVKDVDLNVVMSQALNEDQAMEVNGTRRISLKGQPEALASLDTVDTLPIAVSDLDAEGYVTPGLALPEGVELCLGSKDLKLQIRIHQLLEKSYRFDAAKVEIRGASEGRTAQLDEQELLVQIRGTEEIMDVLTEEDIHLFVDISNAIPGYQPFGLQCTCGKTVSSVTVSPETVNLTVR